MKSKTVQELEDWLSHEIGSLYSNKLGQQPGEITCQLFEAKLAVVLEESVTHLERMLISANHDRMVHQIRTTLNRSLQTRISHLLEETAGVAVIDFLSSTTFDTRRTGMIIFFEDAPAVTDPYVIPKYKSVKNS
ncbi:MAG: DUF2294 domain-containing protein [Leptolyngbyaceae cyanobacterium RM2_2_21]|nr:DUF2294 domain-containing protein [Leptolyngbyaceae cyanobacterium RM2_2_21]